MAQLLLANTGLALAAPASLAEALARVEARLDGWASNSVAYNSLLLQVFGGAGSEPGLWQQAADALQPTLQTSGLAIGLELLDAATAGGFNGAYTPQAPGGGERIYLNAVWLQSASAEQIEAVLLEELGHAIDRRLNGGADSPGDEGERFSALLRGLQPTAASFSENDQRLIDVTGVVVAIEASINVQAVPTIPAFIEETNNFGITFAGIKAKPNFVDIDGDGDLDAFVTTYGNTRFFRNTGSVTAPGFITGAGISSPFGLADTNGVFNSPSPSFADIDDDGDLDFFIGDSVDSLLFSRNIGTGSTPEYTPYSANPFGLVGVGANSIPSFVDIDGDGDLDLFIGNSSGNILFFRNSGSSSAPAYIAEVSNPFGLPSPSVSSGNRRPSFVDIDSDGDFDALINTGGSFAAFRNIGTGTSPSFSQVLDGSLGSFPSSNGNNGSNLADIDGDGDLDLFVGSSYDRGVDLRFFRNTAPVLGVNSSTPNGSYREGAVINIYVRFSGFLQVITAAGSPLLALNVGGIQRFATFNGQTSSSNNPIDFFNTLNFTYTVQPGDNTDDLDLSNTNPIVLNGSSIRTNPGTLLSLTVAPPGSPGSLAGRKDLVIDTTAPVARTTTPTFVAETTTGFLADVDVGFAASPAFVDIDGDGDLDAFIGNTDGATFFFRNTGNTTAAAFAGSASAFGLTNGGFRASPAFADIDGDGDLDAFIGINNGNTRFFRNIGSATAPAFAAETAAFGLSDVGSFASPALADIDGDGDLDAFIGNGGGNTLFFRNIGSATAPAFDSSASAFGLPAVVSSASPALVDIDRDGDLDVFIGTSNGNTLFFRNIGSATAPAFDSSASVVGIPQLGSYTRPAFADIDGDGDLDAFLGNGNGNTLFFRNTAPVLGVSSSTPNGSYGVGREIFLTLRFSEAVVVTGTPRLQLALGSPPRFATYISGTGTDTLVFSYVVGFNDNAADLDLISADALILDGATIRDAAGNDALLTLAAPGSPSSLASRRNLVIDTIEPLAITSTPAFAAPSTNPFALSSGGTFAKPAFADIDRDGDLDAFIGNDTGNILFFLNTATPGATAPVFAAASTSPFQLSNVGGYATPAFIDIDNDGDLDAFISTFTNGLFFFRNNGTATSASFSAASANPFGLTELGNSAIPSFVDIDRDGDLDAFIGNGTGSIRFFRNTAAVGATAPAFAAEADAFGLTVQANYSRPSFLDIDGDGDLDAFIGTSDGLTRFFLNTGSATAPGFSAASAVPFGLVDVGFSASPSFTDIDGDGDVDAFIGNNDGNILFFQNTAPVLGVSSSTPNGSYGAGNGSYGTAGVITLTVRFSEVVFVNTTGGSPTLALETGSTDRFATYSGGSGSNTLTFTYTVQPGDSSADLDLLSADALALNGATIRDAAGNNAALTLASPGSPGSLAARKDLVIDASPVAISRTPRFVAESTSFGLPAVGGSASPTFVDIDRDGDLDAFIGQADGTTRFFRNNGSATAPAFVGSTSAFGLTDVVSAASPTFVDIDADGDLDAFIGNGAGDTVFFRNGAAPGATAPAFAQASTSPFGLTPVVFNASPSFVDIDGDGDLDAFIGEFGGNTLFFRNIGSATAPAFSAAGLNPFGLPDVGRRAAPRLVDLAGDGTLVAFIGTNDANTFFFRNTAAAGAPAAFAADANSFIGLPDVGGYDANPTFVDIDSDGDLDAFIGNSAGSTLFFRNMAPVLGVSSSTANGSYGVGAVITLTVRFSEAVMVNTTGGRPTLALETGSTDRLATFVTGGSGTNTLTFSYTVRAGDTSPDLNLLNANALALNGATIRDAAGNDAVLTLATQGAPGSLAARKALVISTATASITAVDDNVGLIQGSVAAGGISDDRTPTITGRISAALGSGETLRIFNGTVLLGTATVNNTARTWSFTPTLPATAGTTYALIARVADGSGNLGLPSSPRAFTLDTTAPLTTAAITTVIDNVGLIQGDVAVGGSSDDRTPTITGTLSAALASGETLRIFNGSTLLGSAQVDNSVRTWSFTPTLPATPGTTYNLTARVADAAGNLSLVSPARSFVLDTTAPATTAETTAVTDNVGLFQGDVVAAGRTDDITPAITGTLSANLARGETLRIFNGSELLGTASVNNTARTWSFTPTLAATPGTTYNLTARVADATGNLGVASAARSFVLDTTPPATTPAIITVTDNVGLFQGDVLAAGRTDDITPTITGTLSANLARGETLRIFNGSALLGTASVNNTARTWSFTPTLPATPSTTYSITARVADDAGNLGPASPAQSFVLDSTPPSVTSFSPLDGAIGVDPAANLLLNFSEVIQRGTGTIVLRSGSTAGPIVESFDAATSARLSLSSGRLTINPISILAPNTRYFLSVPAGALSDLAGNPFAGSSTYDFLTTNVVSGGSASDILSFSSTVDRLTGLAAGDTFRLTALNLSLLPTATSTPIDRITDLVTGLDSIDAPVARSLALNPVALGAVSEVSASAITALLTPASFPALTTTSTAGVASFTFNDPAAGVRTFLAINDGVAGFSAASDAIIEITGVSGALSSLRAF